MNAELIKALREDAEWAHANEWETPITLGDHLDAAADALEGLLAEAERLNAELYPEKEIEEQRAKRWEAEKRLLQKTREQLAAVTRERDAAISDLEQLMLKSAVCWSCVMCKKDHTPDCHIDKVPPACSPEWRGPQKGVGNE